SHVANGDMVTLALIQGVLNTFVIFFSRVIGNFVDRVLLKNEDGHGVGFWVTTMLAQIVLGILASMIVFWFSRRREFRADAGGAGHYRRPRRRVASPVHDASAAGGADCRVGTRAVTCSLALTLSPPGERGLRRAVVLDCIL